MEVELILHLLQVNKLSQLSLTICLAREGRVEKICFLLVQHACPVLKNPRDIAKLPVNIQKK